MGTAGPRKRPPDRGVGDIGAHRGSGRDRRTRRSPAGPPVHHGRDGRDGAGQRAVPVGPVGPVDGQTQPAPLGGVRPVLRLAGPRHVGRPPLSPERFIGIEAFVHDGHQYTYFGLFPSLIRIPVLLFTNTYDAKLTALALLIAWMTTGVFSALLLWRVRMLMRGPVVLGRAEAASYGVLVAPSPAGRCWSTWPPRPTSTTRTSPGAWP